VSVILGGVVLVLGGTVLAQTGPEQALPEPRALIRVERSSLNVGRVKAGEDVIGMFVFRNRGDRPVKILKAAPS